MKLFKAIQKTGVARRRAAQLVLSGRVTVDGKTIKEPWHEVWPGQVIRIDGEELNWTEDQEFLYYAFHKPQGYVTALSDPSAPHIGRLIKNKKLRPAGRLDKDVSGLLILTNDGVLINKLTHPRYQIEREYIAIVYGNPPESKLDLLKRGVIVNGERLYCKDIKILNTTMTTAKLRIIMTQGRKREIKRLFKAIGHRVLSLKRIRHGPITIELVPEPCNLKEIRGALLQKLLAIKKL